MSLSLLMDEHIDIAITIALQKRSIDVIRAQDANLIATDDEIILDHAHATGRIVFTMDADFLAISTKRLRASIPFSGVIYTQAKCNAAWAVHPRTRIVGEGV